MNQHITASICCLTLAWGAVAQDVIAPPPAQFTPPPPGLAAPAGLAPQGEEGAAEQALSYGEQALTWGISHFKPRLMYRLTYGDGVPAYPGRDYKTFIHDIIPGITWQIGDNWAIDYSPTIRFYSSDKFRDTVNHYARLTGGVQYKSWLFRLTQSFAKTSDPLAETTTQTDVESYTTALSGIYQVNSEVSLELGLDQDLRYAEAYNDSLQWSSLDWLNYQVTPVVGVALGLGGGYIDIKSHSLNTAYLPISDMTFEQVLGRVSLKPGDKMLFTAYGGADIRQFIDSDQSDLVNPVFGVSGMYQVLEGTALQIEGRRAVKSSYENQVSEDTSIGGSIRQRLVEKLFLTLGGGYRFTTYKAQTLLGSYSRDDDGPYFSARLTLQVLKRGTIGLFYYYSKNNSNEAGRDYSSNQGGFEVGYKF